MNARMILSLLIGSLAIGASAAPAPTGPSVRIEILPKAVPARCDKRPRERQILFDLCRDQTEILNEARKLAAALNKTVLVAYGADWCIWCHVFEAHVLGGFGRFDYETTDDPWAMDEKGNTATMPTEAEALKTFVSAHFVIINIGHESASGGAVLRQTGAEDQFTDGLPFVYTIDPSGRFAKTVRTVDAEIRRDGDDPYRGYDRVKLLALLKAAVEL